MKTRSSTPAGAADATKPAPTQTVVEKPTKMLILPTNATKEARLLSLTNPRTGALGRYYFCPKLGLYEFTAITYPRSAPSSTLFAFPADNATDKDEGEGSKSSISKDTGLLIATPVDAIFFVLPILSPSAKSNPNQKLFQALDDILDAQDDLPKHIRYALTHHSFRPQLEKRMDVVCDTVDASGEKMFRLSEEKLLKELVRKAEKMVANGLPASLEERFIRRALETPLQSERRGDMGVVTIPVSDVESQEADSQIQSESQSTAPTPGASSSSVPSNDSTAATSQSSTIDPPSPGGVPQLLRLRSALSFIQSSYIPPHISAIAEEAWESDKSPIDFKPLTEYLKHISKLRAEALASRSLTDFSRKRGLDEFGDDGETRAEKKRRLEEEEKKKKAGTSRGVRDLKKADTSGMKKMSAFFSKAAPAKKKGS